MKVLLVVLAAVAGLAALVGIAALMGSRLPRDHVASVRARYAARPGELWALIADPAGAPSWRPDVKAVELLPPEGGRPAWREQSGFGTVSYVIAESDPPRRLVSRITSQDLPYGGQWEFALTPSGAGTELVITERGFVKPALFRFLARFVFGHTSTLVKYHRALAAKLGETVAPEVVTSGR